MGFRVPFVALVLVTAVFAGCLGAKKDGPAQDLAPAKNETPTNLTLPGERPPSAGIAETNKTEKGLGGVDHRHDYWKGREVVTLFDALVELSPLPIFPDGEGSQPKSSAYVTFPKQLGKDPLLVYEGANRVEVTASAPESILTPGVAHPAPPTLKLQWRTAADSKFRPGVALPIGTAVSIPVAAKESDMPHSTTSLWAFRLTTDRPDAYQVKLKVTVYRGQNVDNWPGHPDFYADTNKRVVLEKTVKTHMSGIAGGELYDQAGTWAIPEKLVSHGTTKLLVFGNVTRISSQTGQDATGYFLEYHNATVLHEEARFGTRLSDPDGPKEGIKAWNFTIPVHPAGMDGPYQPESRWGIRLMATFANAGGFGLCPGCFDYDIEYHLTVIAVSEKAMPPMGN